MSVCVLLTQDALTTRTTTTATTTPTGTTSTTATTTVTSHRLMASCDVTCCHDNSEHSSVPVIRLSTESELADVGESFSSAELPVHCDWLSSSSSLANHKSDLLTLQSLDRNYSYLTADALLLDESYQLRDDSYLTHDAVPSGGQCLNVDVLIEGSQPLGASC